MPAMKLMRADRLQPDELAVFWRVLYRVLDGMSQQDGERWRRFWSNVVRQEPGTIVQVETKRKRFGPYHRMHMTMESQLFDNQEAFQDFELFRNWLKLGAGHVEWITLPEGLMPVPKSISYEALDDDGMREFHGRVVDFLRTEHAYRVLWPCSDDRIAAADMERFLMTFEEWSF